MRWIAHGRDQRFCLFDGIHLRHHQGIYPRIQITLNQRNIVVGDAYDGLSRSASRAGLQLRVNFDVFTRAMFRIESNKVITTAGEDLSGDIAAQLSPEAELYTVVFNGMLEMIFAVP